MTLKDYAHWNEEAEQVWWQEEGRHADETEPMNDHEYELDADAANAYCEGLTELTDEELLVQLHDKDYCARWPQTVRYMELEASERGLLG